MQVIQKKCTQWKLRNIEIIFMTFSDFCTCLYFVSYLKFRDCYWFVIFKMNFSSGWKTTCFSITRFSFTTKLVSNITEAVMMLTTTTIFYFKTSAAAVSYISPAVTIRTGWSWRLLKEVKLKWICSLSCSEHSFPFYKIKIKCFVYSH